MKRPSPKVAEEPAELLKAAPMDREMAEELKQSRQHVRDITWDWPSENATLRSQLETRRFGIVFSIRHRTKVNGQDCVDRQAFQAILGDTRPGPDLLFSRRWGWFGFPALFCRRLLRTVRDFPSQGASWQVD